MSEMIKMILVLSILSLMSGGILAAIHNETREQAELQVIQYVKGPALRKIFDEASNDPTADRFDIKDEDVLRSFFVGVLDGEPRAVAFETFGKGGYGGDVGLMVAVDVQDDELIGARVTTHAETPGMGARAETDQNFIDQFEGLPATEQVQIRQDGGSIDALSGATLTSRAVASAATNAVQVYKRLKPEIAQKLKEFQK